MNKKIHYSYIILLLVLNQVLYSQNDIKLTSFNFNQTIYNPAFTGANEGFNLTGIYSTQWVGFEGAPKIGMLTIQNKFHSLNSGLGLNINQDNTGPVKDFYATLNYSYFINLNRDFNLSLGLKAGYLSNSIDLNILKRMHPEESFNSFQTTSNNYPIIGTGFNLYSEKMFFGVSVPNLLKTNYTNSNFTSTIANQKQYYYATAGYNFENNSNYTFTPVLLTRLTKGAPLSILASINVNYDNKFIGGINYNYNSSIGAFAGVKLFDNMKFAYSYDLSTTKFSNYNSGSHTLILTYNIIKDYDDKCPCHFL